MESKKIAIFLDAENLTNWITHDNLDKLRTELSTIGQMIIRRAYARWNEPGIAKFQVILSQNGFEFIHTYHPVSGKNSADIQLTVDAMEYAFRHNDIECFVLATGDSDFTPLFRRLRELGKDVFGVGPRSSLSECVKSVCSRFIYTDEIEQNKELLNTELDDAIDLAIQTIKAFGGTALVAQLKPAMLNKNPAFDEKSLGYGSFKKFLESIDSVKLSLKDGKALEASYGPQNQKRTNTIDENANTINEKGIDKAIPPLDDEENKYRQILRKKLWRSIPKDVLIRIYKISAKLEPSTKSEMESTVLERAGGDITSSDVKKAMGIFKKAKLFIFQTNPDSVENEKSEDKLGKLEKRDSYLRDIDMAISARLLKGLEETQKEINIEVLKTFLYGLYSKSSLNELLSDAKKNF